MAIAQNSIGSFSFVRINQPGDPSAAPESLRREAVATRRFNVNGAGVISGGISSPEFQLESFVDADSINAAHDLAESYRTLIANGKQVLIFQGRNWQTEEGTLFVVLGLSGVRVRRFEAAAGGLSTSRGAGLWAVWSLQPVPE